MTETKAEHSDQEPEEFQLEPVAVSSKVTIHGVENTPLHDAEDFLSNFAGLREENEQLKQTNQELEGQLEKTRKDLQQLQTEKNNIESQLLSEKEQNKTIIWKLRSEFQKIQEERLQWKEKYLDACIKASQQPTDLSNGPVKNKKRKNDDSENNAVLSSAGMNDQSSQPERPVTNQLYDPETKRFECKECKATFRMFSNLQNHIEKNKCLKYAFQCPQCSIVFSNANSFTKHLKYHVGKTFLCDLCGEKFLYEKGLQRHIKTYHSDISQQFQCQYCYKLFSRKPLLENHIRRHFNYRPFKCNYCDKSFKTRQYLTGHINGVHKNDKQFVCHKCDARFSWRSTWKRHVETHNSKSNTKIKKKRLNVKNCKENTNAALVSAAFFSANNTVLTVHKKSAVVGANEVPTNQVGQNILHFSTQNLPAHLKNNSYVTIHNPQLATITAQLTPTNFVQVNQQVPLSVNHSQQQNMTHLSQKVSVLHQNIPHISHVTSNLLPIQQHSNTDPLESSLQETTQHIHMETQNLNQFPQNEVTISSDNL